MSGTPDDETSATLSRNAMTSVDDPTAVDPSLESLVGRPYRVCEVRRFAPIVRPRDAPVRLNLLNCDREWRPPLVSVRRDNDQELAEENVAETTDEADRALASDDSFGTPFASPHQRLFRLRREVSVLYDAVDEETRVDERHPLLPLQVALFRQWCLLHLIEAYNVDGIFNEA